MDSVNFFGGVNICLFFACQASGQSNDIDVLGFMFELIADWCQDSGFSNANGIRGCLVAY